MYNMDCIQKQLDNGLNVILIHKEGFVKSLFLCATQAGGFDIEQRQDQEDIHYLTGCAHYLEHQMFRFQHKDVTELFAQMQAQTNAFTTYTETCYYFQTTASVYEPLALLLDFVENLDIDEQSVEKERQIILSEYDMYQQSPEQRLVKETYRSLYKNHPIHVDILGHRKDIEQISVEELTKFYNVNYDPSRLTLIGVTGQDVNEVMDFIVEHQKQYPSKSNKQIQRIIHDEQEQVVRKKYTCEMDITTPYVCVAYKLHGFDSIELANKVDLAVQMRLDSLFSTMNPQFQDWIDRQIITQYAAAECDFNCDRGYILFYAQTNKVNEFIELIQELMEEFKTVPMSEKNFEAIQNSYIGANLRGLDNFENLAVDVLRSSINQYDFWKWFNQVSSLTIDELFSICSSFDIGNMTVTKIVPKTM